MSDLREQLIARIDVHLCQFPTSSNAHSVYSNIQPLIEAELQKEQREIARWIRDCQKLSEELTEASKLLEQTIEVLEDFGTRQRNEGYMFSAAEWWFAFGQPLLDNLKALKKEGTE